MTKPKILQIQDGGGDSNHLIRSSSPDNKLCTTPNGGHLTTLSRVDKLTTEANNSSCSDNNEPVYVNSPAKSNHSDSNWNNGNMSNTTGGGTGGIISKKILPGTTGITGSQHDSGYSNESTPKFSGYNNSSLDGEIINGFTSTPNNKEIGGGSAGGCESDNSQGSNFAIRPTDYMLKPDSFQLSPGKQGSTHSNSTSENNNNNTLVTHSPTISNHSGASDHHHKSDDYKIRYIIKLIIKIASIINIFIFKQLFWI